MEHPSTKNPEDLDQTFFTLTPHVDSNRFQIYKEEFPKQYALLKRVSNQYPVLDRCKFWPDRVQFTVNEELAPAIMKNNMQYEMKCVFKKPRYFYLQIYCIEQREIGSYRNRNIKHAEPVFNHEGFLQF